MPALLPVLAVLVAFARLVASPSALIADADRPGVDRALPEDARAVGNDLTRLFLPQHARVAAEVARSGSVPGWDPAGFGGRPLIGNPQAGLWYPPAWLAWRIWSPAALGWVTIAHLALGGIGTVALARGEGLRPLAAGVGGCVWATFPYVIAQANEGHYPHVWAASLYPWTFWAARGWRGGKPRRWLVPALLALACLAGHEQEAYLLGLALLGWAGWAAVGERARPGFAGWAELALAASLFAGLIAIEALPNLLARAFAVKPFRPTAVDASRYHLGLVNLLQLPCPLALGGPADYRGPGSYWEDVLGLGWAPLVLAAWGAGRAGTDPRTRGWLALAVLAVLFAFGRRFVVFDVLHLVAPGMTWFRAPSRALFLAGLGVAMLVGHGVDAIGRGPRTAPAQPRTAVVLAIATLGLALVARLMSEGSPAGIESAVRATLRDPRFLGSFAATGLAFAWLLARPRDRRGVAGALGLVAAAELALYGFAVVRVADPARFLGPDPVGRAIARHRPEGPFRVRVRDAFYGDARAFTLGLEKTNLYDSFQIRHAADLYERLYPMFGSPAPPRFPERFRPEIQNAVLRRMNVALIASDRDEPRLGWPIVETDLWDGVMFTIRAARDPLPRAYVVPRAEVVPDGPAVVDRFAAIDPSAAVILDRDPLPPDSPRQTFTPAEYRTVGPDRVEVAATTERPGLLVVADTWMPGWSAEVDGRPAAILRGNRAQRVVALERPGAHRVVMTYRPPGFVAGRGITLVSLVMWAAVAAGSGIRRRARSRSPGSIVPGPCGGP